MNHFNDEDPLAQIEYKQPYSLTSCYLLGKRSIRSMQLNSMLLSSQGGNRLMHIYLRSSNTSRSHSWCNTWRQL